MAKDNGQIGHFTTEKAKEDFQVVYNEAMALLPDPEETMDIETELGTVRVYLFTQEENRHKEPILLLPGHYASTPMWDSNLEGLMKERPVYTLDLLGEPGMSFQRKTIRDHQDQAKWLNEVLLKLDLKEVHITGVSIGGWTVMNLARYYPERIASIILMDPVFVFASISLKMIILSIPATVSFLPKFIREGMLSYISGGAEVDESVPVAKLIESGMKNYKDKLPTPDVFTSGDLKEIDRPVLAYGR